MKSTLFSFMRFQTVLASELCCCRSRILCKNSHRADSHECECEQQFFHGIKKFKGEHQFFGSLLFLTTCTYERIYPNSYVNAKNYISASYTITVYCLEAKNYGKTPQFMDKNLQISLLGIMSPFRCAWSHAFYEKKHILNV